MIAVVTATVALLPVVLVDNGSRRPASSLTLRSVARFLSDELDGRDVYPASLAFSDSVPVSALHGVRAQTLSETLGALVARGEPGAIVAPLFLGPSDGLRRGVAACASELDSPGSFELLVGGCLVDEGEPSDARVSRALASHVLRTARRERLRFPLHVVVCDHGTPSRAVNAVRERIAAEVRALLGWRAAGVASASMERREGAAYDFNEPLLERCLATPPYDEGDVVLAMAFVLPGRHAGEGGDVAQIVQRAQQEQEKPLARQPLRVHVTPPLATHSSVTRVLADRVRAAEAASSLVL